MLRSANRLCWLLLGAGCVLVRANDSAPESIELEKMAPVVTPAESETLAPMLVTAPAYKAPLTPLERILVEMQFRLNGNFGWPPIHGAFVLTPERVPQASRNSVFAVEVFESERLRASSTLPLFDPLRTPLPAERQRFGARAETRVFRDGVPVNDAFDGSVRSSELRREGLARMEVVPAGGATAWGETPAGVIQLFTIPAAGKVVSEPSPPSKDHPGDPLPPREVVHDAGRLAVEAGSFGTRGVAFVHTEPMRAGVIQVFGNVSASDGFVAVAPESRGAIEEPRWGRDRSLEARWRQPLGQHVEITTTVSDSDESRGLGTAEQHEHAHTRFVSTELAGHTADGFAWNGVAYVQARRSERAFSAVNPERDDEVPVLNEFAEPVTSWGASWTGAWRYAGDARTNIGVDLRVVRGEARSEAGFVNGAAANEIVAGGEQAMAGVFALHQRSFTKNLRASLGLRLDRWSETDGHLRETDRDTRIVRRGERGARTGDVESSPTLGLVWTPRADWRVRAATQESFRRPTLAERYRWWGEGNVLVEPSAALRTEHSRNVEMTVEYSPTKALAVSVRGFASELRDAAGTAAIENGPDATAGFIAPDVLPEIELRRRITLDRVTISGVELSFRRELSAQISFDAQWRWQEPIIEEASAVPRAGRMLPRMPRRAGAVNVTWQASPRFSLRARARWRGRESVDEENSRHVGESVVADLSATLVLNSHLELFLQAKNIGDSRVEANRTAQRVLYLEEPRACFSGVRVEW